MNRLKLIGCAALLATLAADCPAIEMFTYFGDGSRIGLPSLEVPIEAYPGIPLRSDRLRARRRAMQAGPATAAAPGQGTPIARGVTIREMPTGSVETPATVNRPAPKAKPVATPRSRVAKPAKPVRPQTGQPTTR